MLQAQIVKKADIWFLHIPNSFARLLNAELRRNAMMDSKSCACPFPSLKTGGAVQSNSYSNEINVSLFPELQGVLTRERVLKLFYFQCENLVGIARLTALNLEVPKTWEKDRKVIKT